MTDDDLEAGVAAGIITRQQFDALKALESSRHSVGIADEERFRVLGGFNDILVAIGLGLLVAGLFFAASATANPFVIALVAVTSAWGLAEIFTARLRLALPSILLSVMFVASVAILLGATGSGSLFQGTAGIVVGFATTGAALLHYWRFRVPIDIAIAALGVVGVFSSIIIGIARSDTVFPYVMLVSGLAVFALGMAFDIRDPTRTSRTADIGFWLHLLAAPLIVHSILAGMLGAGAAGSGNASAAVVLALFAVLALVAIVVDRRAMLVSGLSYAGYSLTSLIERTGVDETWRTAASLLALAMIVLAVSAGWRKVRAVFLSVLPLGPLAAKLPPVSRG